MQNVTLQFPSIFALIDFTINVDISKCHIDSQELKLTCELNESQIELAIAGFGASLLC